MNSVDIRMYAAARAAAGQEVFTVLPGRLSDILDQIAKENTRLQQILAQCSFLLDGVIVHDQQVRVDAGSTVDVLPPFAGGA